MSVHPLIEAIQQSVCSPNAPATVQHPADDFVAIAEVVQSDRLAAELLTLQFSIPKTAAWSLDALKRQARALAERVQYLLEPLMVIEPSQQ